MKPLPALDQLLHVRHDAHGNIAFSEVSKYAHQGAHGERTRELRRIDGAWFVREDGLPFVTSTVIAERALGATQEAIETVDRLLDVLGPYESPQPHHLQGPAHRGTISCPLNWPTRSIWLAEVRMDYDVEQVHISIVPGEDGLPVERLVSATLSLRAAPYTLVDIEVAEFSQRGDQTPVVKPEHAPSTGVRRSFWTTRRLIRRAIVRKALPPALQSLFDA